MGKHTKVWWFCLPAAVGLVVWGCVQPSTTPTITSRFEDNFNRTALGADWLATNNSWSIVDGHLRVSGARNHPLWLKKKLPRNARIEFDAWSNGAEGDIKCEVYGDGSSYAKDLSYTATSYVVIFGGWHNQFNVVARMDEHGADRRQRSDPKVEPGRHYHWTIERQGSTLRWKVDGQDMLTYEDDSPLAGPGHEFFAFNNWNVELNFDNVVITPL